MPEATVNPDLRLSTEEGNGDFERKEQILGRIKYDWRYYLNDVEFEELSEPVAIALAKTRFNSLASAPDLDAALIAFKLSVMHVRISRV